MARSQDTPLGIDRARHQDLNGRGGHVWWRRGTLVIVAAIPVLGLLNIFGQHAEPDTYQSAAATLLINSPAHVRGGLIFTTEIAITPHQPLHDTRLYLDSGWFQSMSLNGVSPQPANQNAQGRWQIWDYGPIRAGVTFRVWISWQTNPTNLGRHAQNVELYDGGIHLMTVQRTLTVFP